MPAPSKVLHVLGLLAKKEATYGAGIAMSTTADGVLLQYTDKNVGAPVTLDYAFDGSMGPSVASLAQSERVGPSGRSLRGDLPMRFKGPSGTYAATVTPSIHTFLEAAGFTASLSTGSYVYTPTAPGTGYSSLALEMYCRGEKWTAEGVLCNMAFAFDNPQPPIFTFGTRGVNTTLPTDTSAPAITYPSLPLTPLSSGITFTFGSFTAGVVYSGSFDLQRDLEGARVALTSSGGHLGFVPGMRNPMLKVTLEQTAFTTASPWHAPTTFNPYQLREAATKLPLLLKFAAGTTTGGSIALSSQSAQLMDVVPSNNGPTAMVELTFGFTASTAGGNDDIQLVAA
jgi:hypothetical protein